MKLGVVAIAVAAPATIILASCATDDYANVPAAVVDDCQREVSLLTEPDVLEVQENPLQGAALESLPDPIEDAREARRDAGTDAATWPEEALLYRCFESRGIELDPAQAELLDQWRSRPDTPGPESPEG